MKSLLTLALFAPLALQATIIFDTGNHPQPDETNILLNTGESGHDVQGTTVLGHLLVDFTSGESELEPSSGQARVSGNPDNTPLTDIAIFLHNGGTFTDIIMNPFIEGNCKECVSGGTGTLTVDSVDSHGVAETASVFTFKIDNGDNFVTVHSTNGERITKVSLTDVGGSFDDLRQPRISGVGLVSSVPEPVFGYGTGAIGVGLLLFRRIKRN